MFVAILPLRSLVNIDCVWVVQKYVSLYYYECQNLLSLQTNNCYVKCYRHERTYAQPERDKSL